MRACLAICGLTVALAVLAAAPAARSDSSSAAAKRPTKPLLKVTAGFESFTGNGPQPPVKVFFTPSVINVGTVKIVVRNSDPDVAHQVGINGVVSRWMAANGGTAVMKVTFKRPGTYVVRSIGGVGDGKPAGTACSRSSSSADLSPPAPIGARQPMHRSIVGLGAS